MLTTNKIAIPVAIKKEYQQLTIDYDPELKTLWSGLGSKHIPNINFGILAEMEEFDSDFERNKCRILHEGEMSQVDYCVMASPHKGIFSLGGDLALFAELIKENNRVKFTKYAHLCIDNLYARISKYNHPHLTTIGLIQGAALGGGFEIALANDVIIAERQSTFGFPEIGFNLFPGMGALSFLARRIGVRAAEKMVSTPTIYSAEEMHDMGLIDYIVDEGKGELATYNYIRSRERHANGLKAIRAAAYGIGPISKSELISIVDIWVDAAMNITEKDLKMMHRLIQSQTKKLSRDIENTTQQQVQELTLV